MGTGNVSTRSSLDTPLENGADLSTTPIHTLARINLKVGRNTTCQKNTFRARKI